MPTHHDLELVKRIVAGEEKAAEEFEKKFKPRFEFLAMKARVPYEDWKDIAQDIFLTVIKQLKRGLYHGESSLGSWINTIVQRKIADYWRKRKTNDIDIITLESEQEGALALINSIPAPTPDENVVIGVREALGRMPGELRTILILKWVVGLTIKGISEKTGLHMSKVKRRLDKAEALFCQLIQSGNQKPRLITASEVTEED